MNFIGNNSKKKNFKLYERNESQSFDIAHALDDGQKNENQQPPEEDKLDPNQ